MRVDITHDSPILVIMEADTEAEADHLLDIYNSLKAYQDVKFDTGQFKPLSEQHKPRLLFNVDPAGWKDFTIHTDSYQVPNPNEK